MTSSRCSAGDPGSAREIRNAHELVPPRPTRPRNWCNWDKPYRSASKITMQLACLTSTPTSITVVETRIGVLPLAKSAMTWVLTSSLSRPVNVAKRMPANCGSFCNRSAISATECNGGRTTVSPLSSKVSYGSSMPMSSADARDVREEAARLDRPLEPVESPRERRAESAADTPPSSSSSVSMRGQTI